jgi:alpha-glucosidase
MPWQADAPQLGFSSGKPWLPIGPDHAALAVDRQEQDPASLLNLTRKLVALRHANPALAIGSMTVTEARDPLLIFEREGDGQSLLCAFNLGDTAVDLPPSLRQRRRVLQAVNGATLDTLPPFAALVAE